MKNRSILVTLVMAMLAFVALGQTVPQTGVHWTTFQPAVEEFSVQSPTDLKQGWSEPDPNAPRGYSGVSNGVYLYAFSDPIKHPSHYLVVKGFVEESSKEFFEIPGSEYVKTSIEFADSYGFYNRIVICKSLTRVYMFQSVSEDKENTTAAKFISSISVGEKSVAIPDTSSPDPAKVKDALTIPINKPSGDSPVSGSGSGEGTGIGNSNSSGGLSSGIPAPVEQRHETISLRILTKPRPGYTDLARFYGIQGTVPLRVTFLASGVIGSVTPVKRLPFGLTDSAIKAVKSITFEPAYVDGMAVSTTKAVEYTFSIY